MKTDSRAAVHICLASDENYRRGLWVAAATLLDANRSHSMVLHILDGGHRPRTIRKLSRIAYRIHPDVDLRFHTLDSEAFSTAPLGPGNSRMTYARLLCGSLFPGLRELIYVDIDMLINTDLRSATDGFPKGEIVRGVPCPVVRVLEKDCPWALEDFEMRSPYLNAGFLAVNLDAWRESGVEDATLELLRRDPGACRFHDQTVINFVCRGLVALLPDRYNLPPERWREAAGRPGGIIHYLGPQKPWAVWRPEPAFKLWREAWRRHVGPVWLLLLSPPMAASAVRFLGLAVSRRSPLCRRALVWVATVRQGMSRDPVKRRILGRYRDDLLAKSLPRDGDVDAKTFFPIR